MNKFLKVMFIVLIVAMSGAMIFQIFFPEVMGSHLGYGVAVGWQREIGFWNLAVLMIGIGSTDGWRNWHWNQSFVNVFSSGFFSKSRWSH